MCKSLILAFFLLLTFCIESQEPEINTELNVEKIWGQYYFYGSGVSGFRSMNDGEHFSRFAPIKKEKCIVKYSFTERDQAGDVIVNGKDLVYNGKKIVPEEYSFNQNEKKVLIMTAREKIYRRSFKANYYLYDIDANKFEPLDEARKPQTLAKYSPDGNSVSYIFENNLYVKDVNTGVVKTVTSDGEVNKVINGTTDWVYEEEFAITQAYDWSPDSRYIAYLKFNESKVKEFTMTYYQDLYPDLYTFKYPKAGEDNSDLRLFIYDTETGKEQQIDLGDYEYIPRLNWSTAENKLMVQTLNRHQNHLKYHWVDVNSENWETKVIYEEKDDAYVEIDDNLIFLSDGKSFIRTSEKDGYRHIYQVFINGKINAITTGEWDVQEFKGIDEKKKLIYYTSSEEGAQFNSLYSINLKGKKKVKISEKRGSNDPTFSTGMKYFVNKWSDANTPPVYSLHHASGELIDVLEDNQVLQELTKIFNFQPKEFLEVEGAEGKLNAWMVKPPNFDPNKKYPVYFNVYCGPGSNMVKDAYDGGNGAYHQLLAQKGYIVFCVDTRGTMNRGAAFKKSTYLQLGKLETEDVIAVAENLAQLDYVDENRIGIMGWSYGGYMASLAMTKGAHIFSMGIAVAPVTNWRYYDNIYTERFMRTPKENADGYDDNSPINHVDKLEGKYFLIHGSGDDNVHVQNTMEMIKALTEANKQFDLFIYPNKDHGIYGGNTRNHLFQMLLNYTLENL
jgi:dipeptidyl-peptidase-4